MASKKEKIVSPDETVQAEKKTEEIPSETAEEIAVIEVAELSPEEEKILEDEAKQIIKHWWIPLVAGILQICFGIFFISNPFTTFEALSIFAISLLISIGIIDAIFIIINRKSIPSWGWNLAAALVYVVLGILISSSLFAQEEFLILLFSFAFLSEGVNGILLSTNMKREGKKGWGFVLAFGILTILCAFILASNVLTAILYIGLMTGITVISSGIELISSGIILLKAEKELKKDKQ